MGTLQEKEIRGLQLKNKEIVCSACATDEERSEATEFPAEDEIHDQYPWFCVRCKKKVEKPA